MNSKTAVFLVPVLLLVMISGISSRKGRDDKYESLATCQQYYNELKQTINAISSTYPCAETVYDALKGNGTFAEAENKISQTTRCEDR